MIDRTFVDSNILIYAHDLDAGCKQTLAQEHLIALWDSEAGCLSTQVLQGFYVNVTQELKLPISRVQARDIVRNYAPWVLSSITPATIVRASEIGEVWQLSFWDGMIVAAAEQAQATILLSEDLNHGQTVAGIRVTNPFRLSTHE